MKHVIFDFDGTIADSLPLVIAIGEEIMGNEKLTPSEVERVRNMTIKAIIKESGVPYSNLLKFIVRGRTMFKHRLDELKIVKGLEKTLAQLHEQGYEQHIISSNREDNIHTFLQKFDIDQYFDSVKGNVGLFSKTAAIRKLLREQKINKRDCVYVGDEVRDIEASHKLGIPIIAVTWGFNGEKILRATGPEKVVSKASDIVPEVQKLLR